MFPCLAGSSLVFCIRNHRSIFGEWDAPLTGGDADHNDARELQTLGLVSVGERDVALWRADRTAEGGAALVGKIAGGVRLVRAAGQEKEKGDSHTVVPDCVSYDTAAQVGLGCNVEVAAVAWGGGGGGVNATPRLQSQHGILSTGTHVCVCVCVCV